VDYLDYRNNRTAKCASVRRLDQLEKQKVTPKDGYLFVIQKVPSEYFEIKNEKMREELRKLDPKTILAMFRKLNEEAQISAPRGEHNLVRTHNLRRFFNSSLLAAGAPIFYVDYFLDCVLVNDT
jgi:hypothetical protein